MTTVPLSQSRAPHATAGGASVPRSGSVGSTVCAAGPSTSWKTTAYALCARSPSARTASVSTGDRTGQAAAPMATPRQQSAHQADSRSRLAATYVRGAARALRTHEETNSHPRHQPNRRAGVSETRRGTGAATSPAAVGRSKRSHWAGRRVHHRLWKSTPIWRWRTRAVTPRVRRPPAQCSGTRSTDEGTPRRARRALINDPRLGSDQLRHDAAPRTDTCRSALLSTGSTGLPRGAGPAPRTRGGTRAALKGDKPPGTTKLGQEGWRGRH